MVAGAPRRRSRRVKETGSKERRSGEPAGRSQDRRVAARHALGPGPVATAVPPEVVRRRLLISGRVQGVWFRQSTQNEAERIGGLQGYARNLEDGRVEVVVQGGEGAVDRLVAWCRTGPSAAQVDDVRVDAEEPEDDLRDFHVAR